MSAPDGWVLRAISIIHSGGHSIRSDESQRSCESTTSIASSLVAARTARRFVSKLRDGQALSNLRATIHRGARAGRMPFVQRLARLCLATLVLHFSEVRHRAPDSVAEETASDKSFLLAVRCSSRSPSSNVVQSSVCLVAVDALRIEDIGEAHERSLKLITW